MSHYSPEERITGPGFIAALDQSGGSTPKALKAYGLSENAWKTEEEMYELVHDMRSRIIQSPAFDDRVSGVILFERTMNSEVNGMPTAEYLRSTNKAPFLKVDEGLAAAENGVQLMKKMTGLDERLKSAVENGIFGTKMRSVILADGERVDQKAIAKIVDQQFMIAQQIMDAGLMPIVEPEVDIKSPNKQRAEELLKNQLLEHLDLLVADQQLMLKLTLPEQANFYKELVEHPRVLRVVALSGGYSIAEANKRLSENNGVTASFSRALVEDLRQPELQDEAAFTAALNAAIQSIYDASIS